MPNIVYVEHGGVVHTVDAKPGRSVMEAAVRNNIPGIVAECAGACACATCHVYVDPEWREATGEPSTMEKAMLEYAEGVGEGSRLSCQITVTDALDGLVVRLPEVQGSY